MDALQNPRNDNCTQRIHTAADDEGDEGVDAAADERESRNGERNEQLSNSSECLYLTYMRLLIFPAVGDTYAKRILLIDF